MGGRQEFTDDALACMTLNGRPMFDIYEIGVSLQ